MLKNKKVWLLVDGHNLAFRCFYGVPKMTTTEGLQINAIHGWIRSIWKLEDMISPDGICVFFDLGGSSARKNILSTYKANRKETPIELKQQLKYLDLLSIAQGYYVIAREGVEADDLLAAFARKVSASGEVAYIASGDKDFAQCVGGNIFQILPQAADAKGTWRILDRDGIKERFGIFPEQVVDYLSLLGDAADNIPGVPGVGAKGAEKFLNQFGNIDNLLANADKISSEKIRKSLLDSGELIARNRKLIALQSSFEFNLPEAKIRKSSEDIFSLLKMLQLKSLLSIAQRRYSEQPELFQLPSD
jgi:DNA polymerase-1